MTAHETMLDNVAVYALGALPSAEADDVRAHIATCDECREEYRQLKPAVDAVGYSAEACADAENGAVFASPLLKKRIMARIRAEAAPPARSNVGEMRAVRPIVWPAYAVAAACLIVAAVTTIFNISLNEELHQSQTQVAQFNAHAGVAARELARQRTALADLVATDSQRFPANGGEVVRHGNRLYIALNALPSPPKGKVYQAWTLHAGASKMSPSVTFVPNRGGVAFVPLPVNASAVVAVAVSVEPDGGSKQPTSKPSFIVRLS